ncbi:MAG: BON domain-containing protein [Candidatus Binataceae bacterium]
MKKINLLIPATILGLAIAVPAMAQDTTSSPSASQSMRQAGQDMEQAGSDTVSAAKNAATGTVTVVKDTKITAEVKTALHRDDTTKTAKIHVSTTAGVVTLMGNVPSSDTAARAEQIAQAAKGVKSVDNQLAVSTVQ